MLSRFSWYDSAERKSKNHMYLDETKELKDFSPQCNNSQRY